MGRYLHIYAYVCHNAVSFRIYGVEIKSIIFTSRNHEDVNSFGLLKASDYC